MRRNLPPLSSLRAFEAAARHLSFTKAGEELYVTQAAISRQIKKLEEHLKQPLFIRMTRKVELTNFGREYYEIIMKVMNLIEQGNCALDNEQHTLIISILPSLGALWLLQKMMGFTYSHPRIQLDVSSSLDPVDWNSSHHNLDLAIRLGKLPGTQIVEGAPQFDFYMTEDWNDIEAVHLWDDFVTPFCSVSFYEKYGPFNSPHDLENITLLHNNVRPDIWSSWSKAAGVFDVVKNNTRLNFNHSFLVANAMRAGFGMACLSKIELDPVEWRDEIIQPFNETLQSDGAYYLLAPKHKLFDENTQQFLSWVKKLYPI